MFDLPHLERVAKRVHQLMPATPQHHWPQLSELAGADVWLKHENHTPTGAFKIRGGINYIDQLLRREPGVRGVVAASTGNHGQSVVAAARRAGLDAAIVVPQGANPEKCAAMRARGAELIEHGKDFNEAFDHVDTIADQRGWHRFESYHPDLVAGVASYGLELFGALPELDTVYVPIGMGSGCNGILAARDALGHRAEVVGVVAEGAPAYLLSFEQRRPVSTNTCNTFAEGLAVRIPHPEALQLILAGVERVVAVSDQEIADAMRTLFSATHNVAEGAGASTVAALLKERSKHRGRRVAAVISGGNIDRVRYAEILRGSTPAAN